jgi:hypothetical protein
MTKSKYITKSHQDITKYISVTATSIYDQNYCQDISESNQEITGNLDDFPATHFVSQIHVSIQY